MRNLKLVLKYDGTNYCGFQVQREEPTIQSELERAIERITGERSRVIPAGRTDAGVHAEGQVANFKTGSRIPTERVPHALNSVLPQDIVVADCVEVPMDFNARYDARSKLYRYTVDNGPFPSPFWRRYALHLSQPLDVGAMRAAGTFLVGTQDFASFRASGSAAKTTTRTIQRFRCFRSGNLVHIEVQADGFLYHMVRIIAGTLLEVGTGKRSVDSIREVIRKRNREAAGPTAPAHGLRLMRVSYS